MEANLVAEKITCFKCNGGLVHEDGHLSCGQCSSRYALSGNLLDYDNPEFKGHYGSQFKEDAGSYEKDHALDEDFSYRLAVIQKMLLEKVIKLPVDNALELACGTGVLTRGYNRVGIAKNIFATDISMEMLREAAGRERSDNTLYFVQEACSLNVRDGSFDLIFGAAALHHLTHMEPCLGEFHRVLADGGVAIFQEPFYHGYQFLVLLVNAAYEYLSMQRISEPQSGLARLLFPGQRDMVLSRPRYPEEKMQKLKERIDGYTYNIQFQHEKRNSPEELKHLEDKHLYIEEELTELARKVGFSDVTISSPWLLDVPWDRYEKEWLKMTMEIIEAFKKADHLDDLNFDYSSISFLNTIDEQIGRLLLKFMSPNQVIIFQK
jgi:ubiquinone/menaquinone biosynthesis C-methylase UbiE